MRLVRLVAPIVFLSSTSVLLAQAAPQHSPQNTPQNPLKHRSFALVSGSSLNMFGSYAEDDSPLSVYAHAHPGHYLLFWKEGQLYRLDDAAEIDETERLYAPMVPLQARQKELASQQKPFEEQQRILEAKQRAAVGNPAEQARIGQLQGEVGRKQGEIGRQQGEVGRQQGEIGRALYARAVALIDSCSADHTCRPVAPTTATR